MKRVLLSWSSGKDSAWALHMLRGNPGLEICGLLTTLNSEFDRVAMHGTRRTVLEAQAQAAGLPLWSVPLPWPCSNEVYEQRMADVCQRAVAEHVDAVAFGDLFLADVRSYRENQLKGTGLEPLFPLWQIPTGKLAREMIAGGLRARLACVDKKQLPAEFAGRDFDEQLLSDLPAGRRPLRRARRVSHLRVCRSHVRCADPARCRRSGGPRRVCLCGFSGCANASRAISVLRNQKGPVYTTRMDFARDEQAFFMTLLTAVSSAPDTTCATRRSPPCKPPDRLRSGSMRWATSMAWRAGLVQIRPVSRAHAGHQRAAKGAALFRRQHFDGCRRCRPESCATACRARRRRPAECR